ncbi:glutathione S-transferase [Cladochytrium replicatum]|nr:glutathione S-transferase [Cladochytrium replicatum]
MSVATEKQITFYHSVACPHSQRAAIALEEAKTHFEVVPIDLSNKPDWYRTVNPELKVPALKIGDVAIAESLVIVELVAELFPESNLLPKDPISRAKVRWFIQYFADKASATWVKLVFASSEQIDNAGVEAFVDGLKKVDAVLREQSNEGPFFLGTEFSLADLASATFALHFNAAAKSVLGIDLDIEGLERYNAWARAVTNRESVIKTYHGDENVVEAYKARIAKK